VCSRPPGHAPKRTCLLNRACRIGFTPGSNCNRPGTGTTPLMKNATREDELPPASSWYQAVVNPCEGGDSGQRVALPLPVPSRVRATLRYEAHKSRVYPPIPHSSIHVLPTTSPAKVDSSKSDQSSIPSISMIEYDG